MVYKLDEADKLCGVTYIDWSKRYSQIPKATCDMLETQCDKVIVDLDCGQGDDTNTVVDGGCPKPVEVVGTLTLDRVKHYISFIKEEYQQDFVDMLNKNIKLFLEGKPLEDIEHPDWVAPQDHEMITEHYVQYTKPSGYINEGSFSLDITKDNQGCITQVDKNLIFVEPSIIVV